MLPLIGQLGFCFLEGGPWQKGHRLADALLLAYGQLNRVRVSSEDSEKKAGCLATCIQEKEVLYMVQSSP